MRVPMDIMSTKFLSSNMEAINPENNPDRTVARSGVYIKIKGLYI
jgi:hypothetical protein